jgi:hypothetical protein
MGRGLLLAIALWLVMTWRSLVAFREVRVNEVREVLRCWLAGDGLRTAAERAGVDRKTARRYVEAGQAAGLVRAGGVEQLSDGLIGAVIAAVRPAGAAGHGAAWESLLAHEQQIRDWISNDDLQLTNIHGKLTRRGVVVPYRTLHRFAVERCGFGRRQPTLRVADGKPGEECQLDFARMGLIPDPESGRRRVVHALIFTAVYSRHMFVWLSFSQTLAAVIEGCEAAWAYFGGVFRVLIPDNLSPVIADADPVNPMFTAGWLDYAQARGFGTDPARVRSPRDKPRVERVVQYVRGNFFAGEVFTDLGDAQRRAQQWCTTTAGCGCWTRRCPGRGCAPSTGCSAWSAATAPPRSRRPAHERWSSTSWTSPRSPGCSSKPSNAHQPPRRRRWWAGRPASPATPASSRPARPAGG